MTVDVQDTRTEIVVPRSIISLNCLFVNLGAFRKGVASSDTFPLMWLRYFIRSMRGIPGHFRFCLLPS